MEKFLEILKKYRDLIYISIIIIFGIIFSGQCSRINNLNHKIDRQENNKIALTEQIVNYKDELGRVNAEKHAYQLTQEELRDSIGFLKKKNSDLNPEICDFACIFPGFLLCARRAHVLTGESPESARQWEGYSRTARASP